MRFLSPSSSLLVPILALFTATACDARDRSEPDALTCGAPGTNTIMQPEGCFCLAGHAINAAGTGCVPETGPMPSDGGVVASDGSGGTDAGATDGAIDGGQLVGTLREVDTSAGTCAAGCAAVGFPCATSCEEGAGFATYGYYDWDYGWYRGVHQENLASCGDTPAPSYAEGGESYDLGRFVCCCEIPEVTVVGARPADTRTCDEICVESGHTGCAEFAEWPSEEAHGGTLATYYRPATGSVTNVVMGCAAHPPAVRRIAGIDRELRDYRCGCR